MDLSVIFEFSNGSRGHQVPNGNGPMW